MATLAAAMARMAGLMSARLLAPLLVVPLAIALLLGPAAAAPDWPSRPVRIVNTFAAGGAADVLARLVADHLSGVYGQQFFVETRAGAAGAIGLQYVAHTEPDGYTFVVTTLSLLTLAPLINPKLGYDPQGDLANVAYMAGSPVAFLVNAAGPVKSLDAFVAKGRAGAAPLTFSSSGVGSNGHLLAEYFAHQAGIRVEHVPYKGASQGLTDLIGGHLDFSAQTLSSASGLIRGNSALALAHSFKERLPDYPEVPTFRERGFPDMVSTNWFGLAAPAGLSRDIADKVNREVVRLMQQPQTRQRLREDGLVAEPFTVEEFRDFIAREGARWKPIVAAAGMAP